MRITSLAAALAASTCIVAIATPAYAQQRTFDIPAGSLKSALDAYGRQSGRPIIYKAEEVRGVRSPGYRGSVSPDQALDAILANTGFSARTDSSGAVAIVRLGNAQSASVATVPSYGEDAVSEGDQGEIVVTGSLIRGATPASPVQRVTRDDIAKSGYATVADVIRSLPQNFSGGQNPGVVGAPGADNSGNFNGISSVNLRGLGPGATLTLINGHRFAYDGVNNAVDISILPVSAISEVQVVPDGASAIYGADAVAGVVNFILRRDFNAIETRTRVGRSTRGDAQEYQVEQALGAGWGSGGIFVAYEHLEQDALLASDRPFSRTAESPTTLLPRTSKDAVIATARQALGSSVTLSVDGIYAERESDSDVTFFSFESNIRGRTKQYGISGTIDVVLSDSWTISARGDYARDKGQTITQQNFLGEPFPDTVYSLSNTLITAELQAQGTVAELPSGDVKLAAGLGYRRERLSGQYNSMLSATRSAKFAYGEVIVPLLPPESTLGQKLDFSASARLEDYSNLGSTVVPKLGLVYEPTEFLKLRTTWGKSFRTPSLNQAFGLRSGFAVSASSVGVPSASGASVLVVDGASPTLEPERSTSWTVGGQVTPSGVPGLRLDVTSFHIKYRDRIVSPLAAIVGAIQNPDLAPFIVVNPSADVVTSELSQLGQFTNATGGALDPNNFAAIFLRRFTNVTSQKIDGFDLSVKYDREVSQGTLSLDLGGTWLKIKQRDNPLADERVITGTIFNAPKFKARAGIGWQDHQFGAIAYVNHISGERDNSAGVVGGSTSTAARVNAWTTVDAQISFRSPESAGVLSDVTFRLSAQNLFDRNPPRVASTSTVYGGLGYDSANASPLGRFVSLSVTKEW